MDEKTIQQPPADLGEKVANKKNKKITHKIIASALLVIAILLVATVFAAMPPSGFSGRKTISVGDGTSLSQTAKLLADNGIIRSQFLYKAMVYVIGDSSRVMRGDYVFDQPQSVIRVAYRTVHGQQGLNKIKVLIPEGSNSTDITAILKKSFLDFDATAFLGLARINEGYLFPDTYFFYENVSPTEVIATMHANFDAHLGNATSTLAAFNKPTGDIITMASIVEKEASSSFDRQIIAGILWKRLQDKMPLQVDPPFYYILGKASGQLTLDDLATTSPYNLYKNLGLTPTPIDNPGMDAILDTMTPTTTKYWYYLSDKTGKMHYATTFDGHLANKVQFLQ